MTQRNVWLDVDPGHDDATAILMAIHAPMIKLLGVSTVHGNAPGEFTALNAARCLVAFAAPASVLVYPGASKPLLRETKHDPEIHGADGLGGVEGLPSANHPDVLARFARQQPTDDHAISAIEGMHQSIGALWKDGKGEKTTVVACGPQTNLALFFSQYPKLVDAVEEIVFMGGGVGMGNRSAVAEFNILCDPHAAQITIDIPVPKVMVPLNVTHQAILTHKIHAWLLSGWPRHHISESDPLPPAKTPLRHTLHTLVSFFSESYKSVFGFQDGPPMHDAVTIAYLIHQEVLRSTRYRVDIELEGKFTTGETVVDVWDYSSSSPDSWGKGGKNVMVAEQLNTDIFFPLFLTCVERCDEAIAARQSK